MQWSGAGRRLTIASLALGMATSAASRAPHEPAREIRPAVTLVLRIDTGNIRDKMGDEECTGPCEQLRLGLVDTVRSMLAERFPFLRWQNGPAADTIELTWVNGVGAGILGSRLQFQFRGDSAVADSDRVAVDFEKDSIFKFRDDWTPAVLRADWLRRLPSTFKSGDILPRVVGRVPLHVTVRFTPPPERRAHIETPPEALHAERNAPPSFELRVHVKQGTTIDQDATIPLKNCRSGTDAINCPIQQVRFTGDTVVQEATLNSLFRSAEVKWRRTRVLEFSPGAATGGVRLP